VATGALLELAGLAGVTPKQAADGALARLEAAGGVPAAARLRALLSAACPSSRRSCSRR